MIPKKDLELFLVGLYELLENGPAYTNVGICGNLPNKNYEDYSPYDLIGHYSPQWKHFSGDPTFPVSFNTINRLWKGEAGMLRYDLIDFLISAVNKELEERHD